MCRPSSTLRAASPIGWAPGEVEAEWLLPGFCFHAVAPHFSPGMDGSQAQVQVEGQLLWVPGRWTMSTLPNVLDVPWHSCNEHIDGFEQLVLTLHGQG